MAYHEEDIFGDSSIEVILRFHQKAISEFDKRNEVKFAQLQSTLQNVEVETFFQKIKDGEHKITIPLKELDGYWEVFGIWDAKTFSYRVKVHKTKKLIFQLYHLVPTYSKFGLMMAPLKALSLTELNNKNL